MTLLYYAQKPMRQHSWYSVYNNLKQELLNNMKVMPLPDYLMNMKNHRYHKQKHFHYYQKTSQ